jgi:hypothetical protein
MLACEHNVNGIVCVSEYHHLQRVSFGMAVPEPVVVAIPTPVMVRLVPIFVVERRPVLVPICAAVALTIVLMYGALILARLP